MAKAKTLTTKQRLFVDEYIIDLNGTQEIYINNETGQRVLVLRVDDHYVHYQQDGFIKPLFKYQFLEQFTLECI